jgi:hypothetical protein
MQVVGILLGIPNALRVRKLGTAKSSADVTVVSGTLSLGTVIWSNPGNGSGVAQIVPAVPSSTGFADVFAFQNDGSVAAITSDGTTAWTVAIGLIDTAQGPLNPAHFTLPDFQGGFVLARGGSGSQSITKYDGITGQPYPAYTVPGGSFLAYGGRHQANLSADGLVPNVGVHPDGTIFAIIGRDIGNGNLSYSMIGIDPTTGSQKFSVPAPQQTGAGGPIGLIIAGDGYAYATFTYTNPLPNNDQLHLKLLRVNSSGASDIVDIYDWNLRDGEMDDFPNLVTNADQGVLLSWLRPNGSFPQEQHITFITGASVTADNIGPGVPDQELTIQQMIQRQDGSFVGVAYGDDPNGGDLIPYMEAFDPSGNLLWNVAHEQPQIATEDGGVIGQSGVTYDQNGSATGQLENASAVISWSARWYLANGGVSALALPLVDLPPFDNTSSASLWGFAGGNPSKNGTAFLECCFPSLAWVFGPTDHSSDPPDVNKTYPLNNTSCSKSPSQIISDMKGNFGSFANFNGTFAANGFPWAATGTVTFSGTVALGATISIHNVNVDTLTHGFFKTVTFDVAVEVTQVSSNSFTFTTLPGHVLYPATINFAATSSGTGLLSFAININGTFANREAEKGYKAAGRFLEDDIWNHVLTRVQNDCAQ